jgi:hypothetical protein
LKALCQALLRSTGQRPAGRIRVRAHQRFGERLHHRPQQIRARTLKVLAHPPGEVQLVMSAIVYSTPSMSCDLISKDQHGGRPSYGNTLRRFKIRTPLPWT